MTHEWQDTWSPDAWQSWLSSAVGAAVAGGRAAMEVYNREFSVDYKDDRSPLTEADRASQACILAALDQTRLPIVSEESEDIPYATRRSWDTLWLVDPLDGTKEFVKRNGEFTVNVALIHRHRPILGVVYVPAPQDLFVGIAGVGAFRTNTAEGLPPWDGLSHGGPCTDARWTSLSAALTPHDPLRVVASRSHGSPETEAFIGRLRQSGIPVETVSRGSALKLCMIATGEAVAYPRLAPTMEWDTAAAQAVVEGAGGRVVVYDAATHDAYLREGPAALFGARPLRYNRENLLNPWFVAVHPSLAAQ